jgi:hypothetical protein
VEIGCGAGWENLPWERVSRVTGTAICEHQDDATIWYTQPVREEGGHLDKKKVLQLIHLILIFQIKFEIV